MSLSGPTYLSVVCASCLYLVPEVGALCGSGEDASAYLILHEPGHWWKGNASGGWSGGRLWFTTGLLIKKVARPAVVPA